MASEAQISANQQNAQRSTGPRTKLGKARSSKNALRHGVFSEGGAAIQRGPFAEDPIVLERALDELAAALQPRDAIEWQQARRVAGVYNQLRRLDEFTAHALGADTGGHPHLIELGKTAEMTGRLAALAWNLVEALENDEGPDMDPDEMPLWHVFAEFIVFAARPKGVSQWIEDLWTADQTPADQAEWRAATFILLERFFGDLNSAVSWATRYSSEKEAELVDVENELLGTAAQRTLNASIDKTTDLSARLVRQLQQQLAIFGQLAARKLGAIEHDVPNLAPVPDAADES